MSKDIIIICIDPLKLKKRRKHLFGCTYKSIVFEATDILGTSCNFVPGKEGALKNIISKL